MRQLASEVRAQELVDAQPVVQQHPQQGGVAASLRAPGVVRGIEQRESFFSSQAESGGVLGVHRGAAHHRDRVGAGDVEVVLLEQEAVERRQRREPSAGGCRCGPTREQVGEVEIDLYAPGPRSRLRLRR